MEKELKLNPDIPFEDFYQSSRKEASRKKPIFFLHKYFARRITTNFRLLLSSLYFDNNKKDVKKTFFSDSSSSDIYKSLTVLDPFVGGGTTIFEALRFGSNVICNDLQPLSKFVIRSLYEKLDEKSVLNELNVLSKDVGEKILSYYKTICPCCKKEADVVYSFNVKKVHCKNKDYKLFSSYVLAYKKNIFTLICPKCGKVVEHNFDKHGEYKCDCGFVIKTPNDSFVKNASFVDDSNQTISLIDCAKDKSTGYPFNYEQVAVEYYCPHCKSHGYKKVDEFDKNLLQKAKNDFLKVKNNLPIPKQSIPYGYNTKQIINHGYLQFKDLFNERQLLSLGLLLDSINKIEDRSLSYWFQLAFSGMLEMNNMFCRYQQNAYKICNIFFNHAYVPICMPTENNVWGTKIGTGTFIKTLNKIIKGKRFASDIYDLDSIYKDGTYETLKIHSNDIVDAKSVSTYNSNNWNCVLSKTGDSRNLSFIPDNSVDLILTDPPYGANIMYSELIDFFHCWNHMSRLKDDFGFITPLSPKIDEIVINSHQNKDSKYYQDGLTSVFKECYKKAKDGSFLAFSFHDKSFESWCSVFESLNKANFSFVHFFPVQSETRTGAHTSNKDSIGIDIMLVFQKKKQMKNRFDYDQAINKSMQLTSDLIRRFQSVNAEITLGDIQNLEIASFFFFLPDFNSDDEKANCLEKFKNFVENIGNTVSQDTITKKRTGWWSEKYKKAWNASKEAEDE